MLNRDEIIDLIKSKKIINSDIIERDIKNFNHDRNSSFQPGSIDLHVGEIYQPSKKNRLLGGKKNSQVKPCNKISLKPGGTLLVKTLEEINLPLVIGGLCFAPATLSLEGLLIVNIGHIDPGYKGQLHFTIVNLGKECKEIRKSDILVTMLLYKYSKFDDYEGYSMKRSIDEILPRLSDSFMDYKNTIDKKIKRASFSILTSVIGMVLSILLTILANIRFDNLDSEKINKSIADQQCLIDSLEMRIQELETEISQ